MLELLSDCNTKNALVRFCGHRLSRSIPMALPEWEFLAQFRTSIHPFQLALPKSRVESTAHFGDDTERTSLSKVVKRFGIDLSSL